MEDRWFSVDEIAAYLEIMRDTVYKWIAEKRMLAHWMGRLWKFRKEEVNEWVRLGGPTRPDIKDMSDIRAPWVPHRENVRANRNAESCRSQLLAEHQI